MKKYILIACLGVLGLTACEDELNKTPLDKEVMENYFTNESQFELYSNTFYSSLLDKEPYNTQIDMMVKANLSALQLMGSARTTPASGGGWSWTVLRKINTMIAYAKERNIKDVSVKYEALGKFFRAMFYYDKIRRFGDVPWIDHEMFSNDPGLYAARDSRELIMHHMLEDIDFAIENLPDRTAQADVPYRVTKGAALALKSQFCLFEGTFRKYHEIQIQQSALPEGYTEPIHDWEYYLNQCVDASEKLMSGAAGTYKLYSKNKPEQDYRDLFASDYAQKDEVILAVLYDTGLNVLHNANSMMTIGTQGRASITRKLVASFLMKDGSRFSSIPGWQTMEFKDEVANRDPRLSQIIRGLNYKRIDGKDVLAADFGVSPTGYQPIKYVSAQFKGDHEADRTNRSFVDMPVFRYAEVLLNYAEAKAELGTLTQDDLNKSINLIRKRAGMPDMTINNTVDPFLDGGDYGYFNVNAANKGDILEIRRERSIELVMENRRYYDLIRWKCGECLNQPIYGMYVPGPCELDLTGDGKADVVFYANGTAKPKVGKDVQTIEIGKDMILSEGTKGYCNMHSTQNVAKWNDARDYYYPIPTNELSLNKKLKQNPGWDSGVKEEK